MRARAPACHIARAPAWHRASAALHQRGRRALLAHVASAGPLPHCAQPVFDFLIVTEHDHWSPRRCLGAPRPSGPSPAGGRRPSSRTICGVAQSTSAVWNGAEGLGDLTALKWMPANSPRRPGSYDGGGIIYGGFARPGARGGTGHAWRGGNSRAAAKNCSAGATLCHARRLGACAPRPSPTLRFCAAAPPASGRPAARGCAPEAPPRPPVAAPLPGRCVVVVPHPSWFLQFSGRFWRRRVVFLERLVFELAHGQKEARDRARPHPPPVPSPPPAAPGSRTGPRLARAPREVARARSAPGVGSPAPPQAQAPTLGRGRGRGRRVRGGPRGVAGQRRQPPPLLHPLPPPLLQWRRLS